MPGCSLFLLFCLACLCLSVTWAQETPARTRNVIAYLASNYPHIREEFKKSLQSLDRNFPNKDTPLVVFYTGTKQDENELRSLIDDTTNRPYQMEDVSSFWEKFPDGYDSNRKPYKPKGQTEYGYHQMIRFWFFAVFKHPALYDVKYMMRMDTDSLLDKKWELDPFEEMERNGALYYVNIFEYVLGSFSKGLKSFVYNFVRDNHIPVKNPVLYSGLFFPPTGSQYMVYNNWEVTDVAFFSNPILETFYRAVDSSFNIYTKRWGDAPLRAVVLALYVPADRTLMRNGAKMSYLHQNRRPLEGVDCYGSLWLPHRAGARCENQGPWLGENSANERFMVQNPRDKKKKGKSL